MARVAVVVRFARVMAALASDHRNRLHLGHDVSCGNFTVARLAANFRLRMVTAVREVNESGELIDADPLDGLLLLLISRQLGDRGAVPLDSHMAAHAEIHRGHTRLAGGSRGLVAVGALESGCAT